MFLDGNGKGLIVHLGPLLICHLLGLSYNSLCFHFGEILMKTLDVIYPLGLGPKLRGKGFHN